jgi:hypothetical protein
MLGIKLEELPVARKRSMSVSDVASPPPYQEDMPRPRRNSEVVSPQIARSDAWHEHVSIHYQFKAQILMNILVSASSGPRCHRDVSVTSHCVQCCHIR